MIDERNNKQRRLEDTYNDIPDSDPDSDEADHPLENAGKRETVFLKINHETGLVSIFGKNVI